ncbi:IS200/IS605 family transposase [Phormidium sp. FACHB-592]|uniref:IS200/IS605 family transposase n=1 Tax=Stenomitos frigidus AS-A4 TaxID=2933935 RepID=A0ABV0KTH2_9CYAN|nr:MULTISPECIES: IS200/IS605 family transposase [Cyanophyceae]MBD2034502.1 IS200/IS605 family transposase [Leptolyngbya sp. FACHB-321]MBD2078256.1 IS200/IS605 family transposase [Phormidium sp. FACHB-592]
MAKLLAKDHEYRHEGNSVSLINFHFVFVPKRRRPVLVKGIVDRAQEIIFAVAVENRWRILSLGVQPDHVHLLVNVTVNDSAAKVAHRSKGRLSHNLRLEFEWLKKLPSTWTPSYFVGSVGNVSTTIVKQYIESQNGK